jgi:hypothetical protein
MEGLLLPGQVDVGFGLIGEGLHRVEAEFERVEVLDQVAFLNQL